jgi:hypothetical protein
MNPLQLLQACQVLYLSIRWTYQHTQQLTAKHTLPIVCHSRAAPGFGCESQVQYLLMPTLTLTPTLILLLLLCWLKV